MVPKHDFPPNKIQENPTGSMHVHHYRNLNADYKQATWRDKIGNLINWVYNKLSMKNPKKKQNSRPKKLNSTIDSPKITQNTFTTKI